MPYKTKELQAEYRDKNRDRINAYSRKWAAEHPEKVREHSARRDKAKEKLYREINKDHLRELARLSAFRRYWQARKAVIDALGGRCIKCSFDDFRVLECHHKHSGGNKERRNSKGTLVHDYRYYGQMLNHLQDYELLCSNCHSVLTWNLRHQGKLEVYDIVLPK